MIIACGNATGIIGDFLRKTRLQKNSLRCFQGHKLDLHCVGISTKNGDVESGESLS